MIDEGILGRNRIANGIFDESADLTETDIAYHRQALKEVYEPLLHEPSVIDDCCRRFERMFRKQNFFMVRIEPDEI